MDYKIIIMIYPQQDETLYSQNIYQVNPPYNIDMIKLKSPTLPLHFDKSYLPKNICEKQFIGLSECLFLYNLNRLQPSQMCMLESSKFQSCRRIRDLRIVHAIKNWEISHVTKLDKQNRGFYLMGLGRKLTRLQQDYSRQPSTMKGVERSHNLQFQVKQLKWRLDYLNKLTQTL